MERKASTRIATVLIGLAVAVGGLAIGRSADATFPGTNGNIAFIDTGFNISLVAAAGGAPTKITTGFFVSVDYNAASSQLVATQFAAGPLVTLSPTPGSAVTTIPGSVAGDTNAEWYPDGTKVVYQNGTDIFSVNVSGAGRTNLTNDALVQAEPTVSADGTYIAYEQNTAPFGIFKMAPDGGTRVQLTPAATCAAADDCDVPSTSPNNQFVAYDQDGGGGTAGIQQVRSDGASVAPTQLSNVATDVTPDYSPAGDQVVFNAAGGVLTTVPSSGALAPRNALTAGSLGVQPSWGSQTGVAPTPTPTGPATATPGGTPTPTPAPASTLSVGDDNAGKKGNCEFVITRAGSTAGAVTASFAAASADGVKIKETPPATISIAAGQTSATAQVEVSHKKAGTVTGTISNATGAAITDATATCTVEKKKKKKRRGR